METERHRPEALVISSPIRMLSSMCPELIHGLLRDLHLLRLLQSCG